jgi:hypothetical protein
MATLFRDAGARMEEGGAGTVPDESAPSPFVPPKLGSGPYFGWALEDRRKGIRR